MIFPMLNDFVPINTIMSAVKTTADYVKKKKREEDFASPV